MDFKEEIKKARDRRRCAENELEDARVAFRKIERLACFSMVPDYTGRRVRSPKGEIYEVYAREASIFVRDGSDVMNPHVSYYGRKVRKNGELSLKDRYVWFLEHDDKTLLPGWEFVDKEGQKS